MLDPRPGEMREISPDDYLDSAFLVHFALLHFMRIIVETTLWVASIRRPSCCAVVSGGQASAARNLLQPPWPTVLALVAMALGRPSRLPPLRAESGFLGDRSFSSDIKPRL